MAKETKQPTPEPNQSPIKLEGELQDEELETVSGGSNNLLSTTLTNLANMRHEMLKAVANNLRS